MIRGNADIKGVTIQDKEYKISQFADDTTCFVSSENSLQATITSIQLFGRYSGLSINPEKSVVLPLGHPVGDPLDLGTIKLQQVQKVKILGIWFSYDRSIRQHWEWNFLPQISRMKTVCSSWSNRRLSIKGKITVFNSLVFSLLQYPSLSTITPPPQEAIREVQKIATQFIWDNKRSKVAYNTMIQTIPRGGLQVMDLKTRVEINLLSWIRRMVNDPNSSAAHRIKEITREEDIRIAISSKQEPPPLRGPAFHHSIQRS